MCGGGGGGGGGGGDRAATEVVAEVAQTVSEARSAKEGDEEEVEEDDEAMDDGVGRPEVEQEQGQKEEREEREEKEEKEEKELRKKKEVDAQSAAAGDSPETDTETDDTKSWMDYEDLVHDEQTFSKPKPTKPPPLKPPATTKDEVPMRKRFGAECAGLSRGFTPAARMPNRLPLAVIDAIKPLIDGGKSFLEMNTRVGDLAYCAKVGSSRGLADIIRGDKRFLFNLCHPKKNTKN